MNAWSNRILALLALAGFALFLFIIAWWVREPDLIIVLTIVVAMAAYDFWGHPWRQRRAEERAQGESDA
ncbi:fatty acid desaturase [Rhodopseudomonas julia]|uniref:Fatty acid desaturase n=1 Tax=Rhodopseudomonas julia TaxID=200617 RepID=A0ABU0C7E3_9BRAD|nr:hypothetical protein [Rhodopseudomonas julia]MDQ0326445.1 fatty acid desaturase [Rhodopseudomonas julia]